MELQASLNEFFDVLTFGKIAKFCSLLLERLGLGRRLPLSPLLLKQINLLFADYAKILYRLSKLITVLSMLLPKILGMSSFFGIMTLALPETGLQQKNFVTEIV